MFRTHIAMAALLAIPVVSHAQSAQWQQDQRTESQVQQAITATGIPSVLSSVNNGVVTLTGNVRTDEDKARVSQSLANIGGVKTVMNNLTVSRAMQTAPKPAMLVAGTTLPIRLNGEIDTKTAKAGDTFQGTISANVLSGANVALPTGTPVTGRVVEAKAAGRLSGAAELSLELVSVQLNGQPVAITTRELSSKNTGRGTSTVARTGGGAALGAIIGGIAGGGAGAGIGAASGGALGVGSNILRPGQQIILKPEALLQFQTASNLDLVAQPGANNSNSGPSLTSRSTVTGESIPGQPDPYTFDIVGLKLGMTAQQASNAITARVPSISKGTFEPGSPQFTPAAHFTSGFSARASNFSVMLVFTESYPFDPQNPERLSSIFYTAVTPTQTDRDRFEQQALTKYGPPVSYQKGIGGRWCNQGTAAGPGNYICTPDAPNLVLRGGNELILGGQRHRHARARTVEQTDHRNASNLARNPHEHL